MTMDVFKNIIKGFIKGRNLLDGIVTHEMVHQVRKERRRGFLLKLDFRKAYGMIDWDSLMEVT